MHIHEGGLGSVCILIKRLEQRRIQHQIGEKIDRVQASVDWSLKGQKMSPSSYRRFWQSVVSACIYSPPPGWEPEFLQNSKTCTRLWCISLEEELGLSLFSRSVVSTFLQPHGLQHTCCILKSLSFTISQSLFKLMSIESVMSFNHLIFCHPLSLLPSIFPSIRVFFNELNFRIRWPKYWSFSFSISPSNEYSGLISFRIDWFELLAVQGTLKNLFQHHSLKASILEHSAYGQLSHLYMTTEKIIVSTRWTFVVNMISLLFNMLSTSQSGLGQNWLL